MHDLIRILPDSVANQIAAGEVIQRPSSAVKELLENAIDAGAAAIRLIVKDAGRTLLQVVDDGRGMSETDARLSFERHATSKIRNADDLFNLHTMGFRGEALASMAAVAQIELKTRRQEDVTGTSIRIEGSTFISQEPCALPVGTSFSLKNLFYNVPARRNFLKSDTVEFRHIVEEFERIALAHPHVACTLTHNGNELHNLTPGNLRQRIIALYGNPYNQRLVPVDEKTAIVGITGFVGKPEFAKRTRGEQFFFLNKRFIRSSYLHHAVQGAYEQLLGNDSFASYFLFLEVNPKTIDVNIHPTKTEVKFEDERSVYAILRSSVKRALGQYNISPTLDFNQEMSIGTPYHIPEKPLNAPVIIVDRNFNPFHQQNPSSRPAPHAIPLAEKNWQEMFAGHMKTAEEQQVTIPEGENESSASEPWQLHERYIFKRVRSGFLVIDQQRAHERVLYEKYLRAIENNAAPGQQLLFPETLTFSPADGAAITPLLDSINALGFDMRPFGNNTFVVHAIPTGTESKGCCELLEGLLETYKQNEQELQLQPRENIARAMARQAAVKGGQKLAADEMHALIDELFACATPSLAPDGKPVLINFPLDELDRRFKR